LLTYKEEKFTPEMEVLGMDTLEVLCAPGDLVDAWAFTIKNVGKASWPDDTCLCLEDSKE
jgi:hypothetical protein